MVRLGWLTNSPCERDGMGEGWLEIHYYAELVGYFIGWILGME